MRTSQALRTQTCEDLRVPRALVGIGPSEELSQVVPPFTHTNSPRNRPPFTKGWRAKRVRTCTPRLAPPLPKQFCFSPLQSESRSLRPGCPAISFFAARISRQRASPPLHRARRLTF